MSPLWGLEGGAYRPAIDMSPPLGLNTPMHRIPFHVLFSLYIYDTISAVRNAHLEKNPKYSRATVEYHPHK